MMENKDRVITQFRNTTIFFLQIFTVIYLQLNCFTKQCSHGSNRWVGGGVGESRSRRKGSKRKRGKKAEPKTREAKEKAAKTGRTGMGTGTLVASAPATSG